MQLLTHICVQNGSSTGGPDATLKGALVGRLNVGFEWVPQCSLWKQLKMQNKVTRRIHLIFCLMTFALKYEDVSAVEGVSDGSSEGTAIFEVKSMGTF